MASSRLQQKVENVFFWCVNFRYRGLLYFARYCMVTNDPITFIFTLFQSYVDSPIRYKKMRKNIYSNIKQSKNF